LTKDGLNNGGQNITNVAGNLPGAKKDTTAPTTNAAAPNNVDGIKNNAATVGDVLNAGWNLQGNGKDVDFVKPYDTVNFIDGEDGIFDKSIRANALPVNKDIDYSALQVGTEFLIMEGGNIVGEGIVKEIFQHKPHGRKQL